MPATQGPKSCPLSPSLVTSNWGRRCLHLQNTHPWHVERDLKQRRLMGPINPNATKTRHTAVFQWICGLIWQKPTFGSRKIQGHKCCHFAPCTLCMWCHAVKISMCDWRVLCHEPSFLCLFLVKCKTPRLCPEEFQFNANKCTDFQRAANLSLGSSHMKSGYRRNNWT